MSYVDVLPSTGVADKETRRRQGRSCTRAVVVPLLYCVGQFCDAMGRRRCRGRCHEVGS